MSEPSSSTFSLGRVLKAVIPIALIAVAANALVPDYEKAAQQELEADMLGRLLGAGAKTVLADTVDFVDEDGDLVCDAPADDACVTPEKLVFSYIAIEGASQENAAAWVDLVAALSESTGLPVEYTAYADLGEQLSAVARGEVHLVGLNTGATPLAVESAGVTPVCCPGKEDGSFGYTMQFLVPADSKAESFAGLTGKKIAFVDPNSNSGFKAALVLLMDEHDLYPERDYEFGFTQRHETSIKEIAAGDQDGAPVASDLLAGMVANGEVDAESFKVIYESERFPPAVIGHAHNLAAELREAIRETLLGFAWAGTSVEAELAATGAERFVPISYKDDWANIRRINSVVDEARATAMAMKSGGANDAE